MSYRDPITGRWARKPGLSKVFVYGTLKRGEGNHRLLREARFVGDAATKKGFSMTTGGCPFVHMLGDDSVRGEVYEVNADQLARLDQLEGYNSSRADNFYDRVSIQVDLLSGEEIEAFIYVAKRYRAAKYDHRDEAGRIDWSSARAQEAMRKAWDAEHAG